MKVFLNAKLKIKIYFTLTLLVWFPPTTQKISSH